MTDMYDQVGKTFGEAYQAGAQANITEINRKWLNRLYEIKKRDREKLYSIFSQAVLLGSNISDQSALNEEAVKYGKSKGLKVIEPANWLSKLFNKPQFYGSRKAYTVEDVLNRKAFELDFEDPFGIGEE